MTEEKYQIIHVFQKGSVLWITSIQINVLKVYLQTDSYEKDCRQPLSCHDECGPLSGYFALMPVSGGIIGIGKLIQSEFRKSKRFYNYF
jgi:hypothetical protein